MSARRRWRPTILGLRPTALIELYRWRLRSNRMPEALAGLGIAIGVALFFGALVANTSLTGSAGQLLQAVTGQASIQLAARSPEGFDERTADRVRSLPGVKVAAPLLRANVTAVGPKGRQTIQLVGLTGLQLALNGTATQGLGAGAQLLAGGIGLPIAVADEIGAYSGGDITLLSGNAVRRIGVRAVLGSELIGALADSPIVVTLLGVAQRITALPHRITEILIKPQPGERLPVEQELRRLAAGRLDVEPPARELSILRATAEPTSQSTELFAAIAAMVGFLLALNAMLLTVPERRRFSAELRQQGFSPKQILLILTSQAAILGLAASVVGVLLGDALSHTLFHQTPSYLTLAFPIGTRPILAATTILAALASGLVATVLASLLPMIELRRRKHPRKEIGALGQLISVRAVTASGVLGCALVVAVTGFVLALPSLSIIGGVVLALSAFCLVPAFFALTIQLLTPVSERVRGSMLALAMVELRATATRSIALASVAALAVYGMVAVQGARHDLINGLNAAIVEYLDTADVWVTRNDNFLTIDSFRPGSAPGSIAREPGVSSVRAYQGALLDVGSRRLWIRARPAGDKTLLQASQMVHGDLARATRLIRGGGWAAISDGFARERGLRVGSAFSLPTPSGPATFGVAAITTNVGWPPGAITLNTSDFGRDWQSTNPTALEVNLKPGTAPSTGKREVEQAVGRSHGLIVETTREREARYEQSARQGIASLGEISTLLLVASALAIASALSASIWQRRRRLASLKAHGFDTKQLWRSLLLESAITLTIGCLDGTILGIYGHSLASRWLSVSVGFPAPFSPAIGVVAVSLALITGIALAVVAVPGLQAARVAASESFGDRL
jgi:putative ABC transport system permease protein